MDSAKSPVTLNNKKRALDLTNNAKNQSDKNKSKEKNKNSDKKRNASKTSDKGADDPKQPKIFSFIKRSE